MSNLLKSGEVCLKRPVLLKVQVFKPYQTLQCSYSLVVNTFLSLTKLHSLS